MGAPEVEDYFPDSGGILSATRVYMAYKPINVAAAVGYNQTFNCNFAAVNRGVDRNWIVATIEEAHDYDCPTKTVGKNQASALARERETTVSAAEAPGATV